MVADVSLELGQQQRLSLLPTALVTDRVLDLNFVKYRAVVELNEQSVTDAPLLGVMVVDRVGLVLDAVNLLAECVDARVRGGFVGAGRWLARWVVEGA